VRRSRRSKTKKAKTAVPYVRRLAEDEQVQKHVRDASAGLRQAYGRVARKRGRAVEDKKLYGHLRGAATSVRQGALALQRGQPDRKRRGRKVVLVAVAGGAAALIASRRRGDKAQSPPPTTSEQPSSADGPEATSPAAQPSVEEKAAEE
jgi:hypothetical protein